jgi:hypothetical protein
MDAPLKKGKNWSTRKLEREIKKVQLGLTWPKEREKDLNNYFLFLFMEG